MERCLLTQWDQWNSEWWSYNLFTLLDRKSCSHSRSLCEGRRGIGWLGWENTYSLPARVAFTDPGGSHLGQSSSPDPFLMLRSVLHFLPVIVHPGLNLVTITVEIWQRFVSLLHGNVFIFLVFLSYLKGCFAAPKGEMKSLRLIF